MVKNLPCSAGDAGSIAGQGTKILHATVKQSPRSTTTEPKHHNQREQALQQKITQHAQGFHKPQLRPEAAKSINIYLKIKIALKYSIPFLQDVSGNVPAQPGFCRVQRSPYPPSFKFLRNGTRVLTLMKSTSCHPSCLFSLCKRWTFWDLSTALPPPTELWLWFLGKRDKPACSPDPGSSSPWEGLSSRILS